MSEHRKHAPFRGWLAHLQKLNSAGPLDTSGLPKPDDSLAAWNRKQLRNIEGRGSNIDHDREVENDNPLRNA